MEARNAEIKISYSNRSDVQQKDLELEGSNRPSEYRSPAEYFISEKMLAAGVNKYVADGSESDPESWNTSGTLLV